MFLFEKVGGGIVVKSEPVRGIRQHIIFFTLSSELAVMCAFCTMVEKRMNIYFFFSFSPLECKSIIEQTTLLIAPILHRESDNLNYTCSLVLKQMSHVTIGVTVDRTPNAQWP